MTNLEGIDPEKLESFERAFDLHMGTCRMTCACGKEYWDAANGGYDWEDGEVERLENDPNAVALNYSVGAVCFEGNDYVVDCPCWHKRAKQIMRFIDGHSSAIAEYLTNEKKRKQAIADRSPVVKEDA